MLTEDVEQGADTCGSGSPQNGAETQNSMAPYRSNKLDPEDLELAYDSHRILLI